MSLLEVITKASSAIPTLSDHESDYPILLNPDPIFENLKLENANQKSGNHVKKVSGWEISQIDHDLIELGQNFLKKLKRKLKDTNSFGKVEFLDMLTSYLENFRAKVGIQLDFNESDEGYACKIVDKLGILMARDVKGLVLECCVVLEVWDVLEVLIINGLVEHAFTSNLVTKLIEKRKSDVIVTCIKHLPELQAFDLMCILRYFLLLPSDGYKSLVSVRDDWESQALLAIKTASEKETSLAKAASILVMLAHDGFSVSELCLHYFLAAPNLDEVIFSACVGKLNGEETKALIRYLGKWLKKYERFPQVGPCPKASAVLGLKVCEWVPTLETVVKCLGVVVDEHFSSLVLGSEFDELKDLEGVVGSLAAEARLCGGLASLTERLRIERQASCALHVHAV
ncbi:hypothetical protein PHJA_002260600 [Phtheirospermum japonicum]|uniref:Uncharacterized protein n=1 Tax=Phtheirospermum japonicum TaxID=374723 RepID=A0A830CPD9_9LAMI|nr:hypothetical protein PHJA_002260600 [Phtheirospermum japonicum]